MEHTKGVASWMIVMPGFDEASYFPKIPYSWADSEAFRWIRHIYIKGQLHWIHGIWIMQVDKGKEKNPIWSKSTFNKHNRV